MSEKSKLSDLILKHINEDLPNQVGEALKLRLEMADSDANNLIEFKAGNETLSKEIDNLKEELKCHRSLDSKVNEYNTLKVAVEEKERNQKVTEAEFKLAEAEKRADDLKALVTIVFRSPVFSSTAWGNRTVHADGYNQSMPYDETKTTKEDN